MKTKSDDIVQQYGEAIENNSKKFSIKDHLLAAARDDPDAV